jgi:hypothetical protein
LQGFIFAKHPNEPLGCWRIFWRRREKKICSEKKLFLTNLNFFIYFHFSKEKKKVFENEKKIFKIVFVAKLLTTQRKEVLFFKT